MPEPKSSENSPKVVDATSKYLPEYISPELSAIQKVTRIDKTWPPEKRERVYDNLAKIWAALSVEIERITGEPLPPFNEEIIQWVKYEDDESTGGDNHPITGLFRFNENAVDNPILTAKYLAHEIFHFLSQRKIVEQSVPISARSGLAVVRNALMGGVNYQTFGKRGFDFINEAVIEEISSKALEAVKSQLPEVANADVSALAYPEARRFYHFLIQNITLAWNNPELRGLNRLMVDTEMDAVYEARTSDEWLNRFEKLKESLGLPDKVSEEDLIELFERGIYDKHALKLVALIINMMLGDGVYQYLVHADIDPRNMGGGDMYHIWSAISGPVQEVIERPPEDISFAWDNATLINIPSEDIPLRAPTISFDEANGHVVGILEELGNFKAQFENPASKAYFEHFYNVEPELLDDVATQSNPLFIEKQIDPTTSRVEDLVRDFTFKKILTSLNISDTPAERREKNISPDRNLTTEYFSIPDHPDVQLAKYTVETKYFEKKMYFFVK